MAGIMDTLSKISGNAAGNFTQTIQQQGDKFQQKVGDAIDIGEQYAIAQLVLQAMATFAALGMLHMYHKTYNLSARRHGIKTARNSKRRRSRRAR